MDGTANGVGIISGALSTPVTLSGSLSPPSEMSGELSRPEYISAPIPPATTSSLGGIIVGEDLEITQSGVLSVIKATQVEQDNMHPITAAAVFTEVGNINALLQTI